MDQSESAILNTWDADILLPWLQPWLRKKDGCLINYSPSCRAYPRGLGHSPNSWLKEQQLIRFNLPGFQIALSALSLQANPPKRVSWKMSFMFLLAKCVLDKTQLCYSSSSNHNSQVFFTVCSNGERERVPTAVNLLKTSQCWNISLLCSAGWFQPILVAQLKVFFIINLAIILIICFWCTYIVGNPRCSTNTRWKTNPY